jgi:hypothetical protein
MNNINYLNTLLTDKVKANNSPEETNLELEDFEFIDKHHLSYPISEKSNSQLILFSHNKNKQLTLLNKQLISSTTENQKDECTTLLHEIAQLKEQYYVIANQLQDSHTLINEMNNKFDTLHQSILLNNSLLKSHFQRSYLYDVRDYAIRASIPIICTALVNTPVALTYGLKKAALSYVGSYILYKIIGK